MLLVPSPVLADISIASKNIRNLGWGENKSFHALARILARHDLLAIQEVMNREGILELQRELEGKTGVHWGVIHSDRLGTTRYREKYAFLWREDTVEYVDGAVIYIDDAEIFLRPPFSARFRSRSTGNDLVLATVHIVHGHAVSDRIPEIHALRQYWDWLAEVYPETAKRRILAGDFNLGPHHPAWAPMREMAINLIEEGATTLSTRDRIFANLYDLIWIPIEHDLAVSGSGIVDFPDILTLTSGEYWTHEEARRHVSDHAPVFIELGDPSIRAYRMGALRVPNRKSGDVDSEELALDDPVCVDLNHAEIAELQQLIHIGRTRAEHIVDQRPWADVDSLQGLPGLGSARIKDLKDQGLVCP